jgi:hypothetical protein
MTGNAEPRDLAEAIPARLPPRGPQGRTFENPRERLLLLSYEGRTPPCAL